MPRNKKFTFKKYMTFRNNSRTKYWWLASRVYVERELNDKQRKRLFSPIRRLNRSFKTNHENLIISISNQ